MKTTLVPNYIMFFQAYEALRFFVPSIHNVLLQLPIPFQIKELQILCKVSFNFHSCLWNLMHRAAWWATYSPWGSKSRMQLRD